MQRSTVLLAGICLLLSAALGVSLSVINHTSESKQPSVSDVNLEIGLPDLKPDKKEQRVISSSAVLWDLESDVMVFEQNAFNERSIASLTKIMTAMVAIDFGVDWAKNIHILPEEFVIGGNLNLAPNETVTMKDLLHASLMGSANNATLAFVRGIDIPEEQFIQAMNRKAIELGLEKTFFTDVTGLNPTNRSNAYEVARFMETAFTEYPDIYETASKKKYEHTIGVSGRQHTIVNTNNLMVDYNYNLSGSKTGYLNEAGFCLAVRGANNHSNRIAVVLGAPSEWDSMNDIRTLLELP